MLHAGPGRRRPLARLGRSVKGALLRPDLLRDGWGRDGWRRRCGGGDHLGDRGGGDGRTVPGRSGDGGLVRRGD
ncbi:MAG: hypothetical protein ACREK6_12230, partial [Candidatus Rokuibacteriota bacterium]